MRAEDFDLFCALLRQRSGLVLTQDKAYLLESRLMPVARKWNLKDLEQLAATVRMKRDEALLRDITEAMTTNESSFFRDQKPFDQFRQFVLPQLLAARGGRKHLRIWSAACSSGQEPYSLAMILDDEAAKLQGWTVDIIATDLSSEMVERAKAGVYSQFEVQRGLPILYLVKYFKQNGDRWQIDESLRRKVQFREFNLLQDPSTLGVFDIVFCRNVLIYFDQPTKSRVLDSIASVMARDGILYLGGAETVLGITDRFRTIDGQRGLYRINDGSSPVAAMRAVGAT